MKIFMIAEYFWPGIGGLESSTAYLADALRARCHVEVFTPVPAQSFVDSAAFPVHRFDSAKGPPYPAMWSALPASKDRAAVCFYGFSEQWLDAQLDFMARCRREKRMRVLVKIPTLHEYLLYINSPARLQLLLHADYLICPNRTIREHLIQLGIPPERAILRPNGVPIHRFVPADPACKQKLRTQLRLDSERLTFIFTGRFAERKRVGLLAEAFAQVPQVNLLLLGYFDNRFDAGSTIGPIPGPNVRVLDPTSDVRPYLQAADIFVSASVSEGMSNALLEGLACGLPALVTAIPGHEEAVRHGETGYLYAPDHINDLMAGIRWFINHRPWLPQLSASARRIAEEQFDIASVAEAYCRLLDGAVA